jgi:hypothetical protein
MRHELDAVRHSSSLGADAGTAAVFGWRHVATLFLLLVTLPVFAAAGVVALAALPFILAVGGLEQVRQLMRPDAVAGRAGH